MERIMNEENDWYRNVEGNALEGPEVCVSNEMKTGRTPGPSEVSLELIAASGGVGIDD